LDNINIMLNLISMENGKLVWSCRVEGDLGNHYQELLGRLADTLRNYLEIRAIENQVSGDLSAAFPNSSEACRYYRKLVGIPIKGMSTLKPPLLMI
jgi:hypothetical protein